MTEELLSVGLTGAVLELGITKAVLEEVGMLVLGGVKGGVVDTALDEEESNVLESKEEEPVLLWIDVGARTLVL